MKRPEERTLRVVALLLLSGGLVTAAILPGLTPSLTDSVEGKEKAEPAPDAEPVHDPERALTLKGVESRPGSALAHVANQRDAPAPPPLPEVEGEDPLPDALRTLARSGTAADDAPVDDPALEASLDRAGRLPQGLQEDLALVVLAVAEARDLQAEAVADLSPTQRQALASGDLGPDEARELRSAVDMDKSLQAARLVDAAVRESRPSLEAWSEHANSTSARTKGLAAPAQVPTVEEQAPSVLASLSSPETPGELLAGGAKLQGTTAEAPPTPDAIQEATLEELLLSTYVNLGIPKSNAAVASLSAAEALPDAVREVATVGLRHYLHALVLQTQALSDLTPAERRAVAEVGPAASLPADASELDVSPTTLALARSGIDKIDRRKVFQAAGALVDARQALGKQSAHLPADHPSTPADGCPQDTRNAGDISTQGVSPLETDRPVTCSVGDLTVRLGLADDGAVVLTVDNDGDGEPEIGQPIGRDQDTRLHWDPDKLQVTVYTDENDDDEAQDDEIEFQTEPLRDRGNNVAFVDPFGLFVVGSEEGPTVFDDRYGRVPVPPEPRDERVSGTRSTLESTLPVGADNIDTSIFIGGNSIDTSRVDDTVWRQLQEPTPAIINPNATHLLTVDLDGDSTYTRNIGGFSPGYRLYGSHDRNPDGNYTVAGFDTGEERRIPRAGGGNGFDLPAAAIDLGGDDTYRPNMDWGVGFDGGLGNNRTVGSASVGSAGVVVDEGGDDTYQAENGSIGRGSQASVGLVADLGGDDSVRALNQSLGSGLTGGTGLFLDRGGNDTYDSGWESQGAAFLGESATGVFVDAGDGDDVFEANFTPGNRIVSLGSGDALEVPKVAQGGGTWSGTGIMLDGGGDDTYIKEPLPEGIEVPRVQGTSFGRTCLSYGICVLGRSGLPGILADLGGNDTGLRVTGTIEHSRLATVGVGPHFTKEGYLFDDEADRGNRRVPTGYVLDAEVADDPSFRGDGYLFAPGDVTWDSRGDPLGRTAFTLTVPGLLAVGDTTATGWNESYMITLDLGGQDTYENRPGAANLVPSDVPTVSTGILGSTRGGTTIGGERYRPRLASLHLDLGGSDRYEAEAVGDDPSSHALGSGTGAVGLAYDLDSTGDAYEAGTQALGHGELGVGVFYEETGDDVYRFKNASNPSEGLGYGSVGGVGVFADAGGSDGYHAENLTLGAYNLTFESEGSTLDNQGDTLDNGDFEAGAGVFLDGRGADTYDVGPRALGHVDRRVEETSTVDQFAPQAGDSRAVAALFVDDGFAKDEYPAVHLERDRGNNDFWNTTRLGLGFDNLDYYVNYQLVWSGDETARRAISLLLSPSARIVDPAYPKADPNATLETLTGNEGVTVNASYGGTRSVLMNARSLATAPLRTNASVAGVDVADPVLALLEDFRDRIVDVVPSPDPSEAPGAEETAHYGIRYANATYYNLQYMMSDEDHRDRPGASRPFLNETQRGLDMVLAPAGARATWPDALALLPPGVRDAIPSFVQDRFPEGPLVSGEDSRGYQNTVGGIVYGYLDGPLESLGVPGATDFTQALVVDNLNSPIPAAGSDRSPNDVANQTFDEGQGAVDEAGDDVPTASPQVRTPGPDDPQERRWTLAQHLLLVKALAAGVPDGQAVGDAVDEALVAMGAPSASFAPSQATKAGSGSPTDCGAPLERGQDVYLSCVIRASFHTTVDAADELRGNAEERCRSLDDTGDACEALPEVVNPPTGGQFVKEVALSADEHPIATVPGQHGTTYEIGWDTAELTDDGRYVWEDGNHTLTAKVYYRQAEPRPNRDGIKTDAPDERSSQRRTSDPYGFYPGTDRVQVATDNPPRMYEASATDFNPEPGEEAHRCGGTLDCLLTFNATFSEPLPDEHVDAAVEGPDGSTLHQEAGAAVDANETLSFTWDPSPPSQAPDGRYRVNVTFSDDAGAGPNRTYSNGTAFFVTREAPTTLAHPASNDAGYSGYDHVEVERLANGTVNESAAAPWTLPVTAELTSDDPRSPVAGFHLYRRVYDPGANQAETEFDEQLTWDSCPGETVNKSTAGQDSPAQWCRLTDTLIDGNTTAMNITTYEVDLDGKGVPDPMASRRHYLVARAVDAAGNNETRPFPDVGPSVGTGDPEGETFVDLTDPKSSLQAEATAWNVTRIPVSYTTSKGPVDDVRVQWDVAPTADEAGSDPKPLPDDLVDQGSQTLVWDADHPGVDADPETGDRLFLIMRAVDAAGNVEEKSRSSIGALTFDFAPPRVDGNVTAQERSSSITVNWTSTEATPEVGARYWPAGEPENATELDVTGTPLVHQVVVGNLTQNERYVLELRMRDLAGNWNRSITRTFETRSVVGIEPVAPKDGDVVSDEAEIQWIARNVTADPFVQYNLTLVPGSGDCTGDPDDAVQLDEVTFFERDPATRTVTFDTEDVPSVRTAHVCLAANNTLNPENPVVQRIPPTGSFALDNEAPETNATVTGRGDGEWIRTRATVELAAVDDTNGTVTTTYVRDGGSPQEYTDPITFTSDGVHTLTYWSVDDLGHAEERNTLEIPVDTTPPNGTLAVDGNESRTSDLEVDLTIDGRDGTSGLSDVVIRSPEGRHRPFSGALLEGGAVEVPWTVSAGDGRKDVIVDLYDEAGNQLTLRGSITLDTTPPGITRSVTRSVGFTQAAVEWSTDEPTTGAVLYKEEGSPAFQNRVGVNESGVQHTAVLEDLTPSTRYVAKILAEDPLGTTASETITFTTDTDATPPGPVEDVQVDVLPTGFVQLNWTAAFDEVGVESYVVARSQGDDTFTRVATTPRTVLLDDEAPVGETLTYKVQAVDVGGNAGPPSGEVTATTRTAPEILEAEVTPERGTPDDTFTYRVVVRDRDGDTLESVQAIVDGEARSVTPEAGGDIETGRTYTLETGMEATTLSRGTHTYAFQVDDGTQDTRWPGEEPRSGPVVVEAGDDTSEVAGFGAVRRAIPAPGPLAVLASAAVAGAVLLTLRRWTP
jgi:hypothetical protein